MLVVGHRALLGDCDVIWREVVKGRGVSIAFIDPQLHPRHFYSCSTIDLALYLNLLDVSVWESLWF